MKNVKFLLFVGLVVAFAQSTKAQSSKQIDFDKGALSPKNVIQEIAADPVAVPQAVAMAVNTAPQEGKVVPENTLEVKAAIFPNGELRFKIQDLEASRLSQVEIGYPSILLQVWKKGWLRDSFLGGIYETVARHYTLTTCWDENCENRKTSYEKNRNTSYIESGSLGHEMVYARDEAIILKPGDSVYLRFALQRTASSKYSHQKTPYKTSVTYTFDGNQLKSSDGRTCSPITNRSGKDPYKDWCWL